MGYVINIEGFEGQTIEVQTSFLKGPQLLVNGIPIKKESRQGGMVLQRNDGREVVADWKPQSFGFDIPQLSIDGKTYAVVEPLKWYQWVWGGWPVLLVAVGGAIGAILGLIALMINTRVFRAELTNGLKYIITAVVSVSALIMYLVIAVIIQLAVS